MHTYRVGPDVTVLNDHLEVPGIGFLPINAFVLHAAEPVVIDTGLSLPDRNVLDALAEVIDPADVRWIWLTHPDRDHTGGLFDLLAAAPLARIVTTFVGAGIMSTEHPLPMDRVYLLNPGQTLDVGDRRLTGFRPPLFDNPATVGLHDSLTGTAFTSDCFGAPLPSAELASCTDSREIPAETLRTGQLLWAAVDSPWVHDVDPARFQTRVDLVRATNPTALLSTHLPPAIGLNNELFTMLTQAPTADPFIGPDQQALEQMLASFEPAPN